MFQLIGKNRANNNTNHNNNNNKSVVLSPIMRTFQLIGHNRANNNNKSVVLVTHQADVSINRSQS